MISIIVIINKPQVYNDILLKSLEEQSFKDYEIVEVDNTHSQFDTLAEALNDGLSRAKGDMCMFVHPDISFRNQDVLENIVNKIIEARNSNPDIRLFGIAGAPNGEDWKLYSTMYHGTNQERIGENVFEQQSYQLVQTIDACFYAMSTEDIKRYGFWSEGRGFHMCVEDLSLRIREDGYQVAVVPADIWHRSSGDSLDYTYFREARRLLKAHPNIPIINTTSMQFRNTRFADLYWWYRQTRSYIFHKYVKKDR